MHGTSHRPNIIIKPAIATDRRLWKRAPKKWNFHLKTNASNNIDADYTAFRETIWAREMFRSLWFVGYDIWVRWVNWQKPQWTSTSRRSFKSNTFTMNRLLTQWISEQQRSLCELKGPTVLFRPVSACRPSDPDTFRAISLTLIPYISVCFVCLWLEVFFNSFFIFRFQLVRNLFFIGCLHNFLFARRPRRFHFVSCVYLDRVRLCIVSLASQVSPEPCE